MDDITAQNVGSYLTLDARLGWKPARNWEISIVGQNLFHDQHLEFVPEFINTSPTEVERGAYAKITYNF